MSRRGDKVVMGFAENRGGVFVWLGRLWKVGFWSSFLRFCAFICGRRRGKKGKIAIVIGIHDDC